MSLDYSEGKLVFRGFPEKVYVCEERNAVWWGILSGLFFNYYYLIEISKFIHSSWITNVLKTCRMPGLRKGILFPVLLSCYPLLTLGSVLKVNNFLSQRGRTFLYDDFYKRSHFVFGFLTFLSRFILLLSPEANCPHLKPAAIGWTG